METKGVDPYSYLDSLMPPEYKSVLVCLLDHQNEHGESYISRADICKYTNLSPLVVDGALVWLEDGEVIDIEQSEKFGEIFLVFPIYVHYLLKIKTKENMGTILSS